MGREEWFIEQAEKNIIGYEEVSSGREATLRTNAVADAQVLPRNTFPVPPPLPLRRVFRVDDTHGAYATSPTPARPLMDVEANVGGRKVSAAGDQLNRRQAAAAPA